MAIAAFRAALDVNGRGNLLFRSLGIARVLLGIALEEPAYENKLFLFRLRALKGRIVA
jgi:hypothetical protein